MTKPLRIYVDTSVVGGCLDDKFAADSRQLFELARRGIIRLLVSDVLFRELSAAPPEVRALLPALPPQSVEIVSITEDVLDLRDAYLQAGVVGAPSVDDAAHVAAATVARADAIVSWNFRHIVRLDRIRAYNQVNLANGYGVLTILTPREVRLDEAE